MDENKVIRPMDFVRLTNIDELNVIKDTKNHIGLVKEVSRDGRMSIIWIGETYSQLAWFKSSELEVVDNLVSILTCGLANGTVTSIWTVDIKAGLQMKLTNNYTYKWGMRDPVTGKCENVEIREDEDTWKLLKQDDTQP